MESYRMTPGLDLDSLCLLLLICLPKQLKPEDLQPDHDTHLLAASH